MNQSKAGRGKTLFSLFLTYMKIGLFTFGGGYAMIALIEDEIVSKKGWITKEELTDIVTVAESTPGPIAINCSTYVGYKIGGFLGSAIATTAVVIPSFVIIYLISLFFKDLLTYAPVKAAFNGIQCAVGLIIIRTGIKMAKSFRKTPLSVTCFVFAILAILLNSMLGLGISPVILILIGAVIGVILYFVNKRRDSKNGGEA